MVTTTSVLTLEADAGDNYVLTLEADGGDNYMCVDTGG